MSQDGPRPVYALDFARLRIAEGDHRVALYALRRPERQGLDALRQRPADAQHRHVLGIDGAPSLGEYRCLALFTAALKHDPCFFRHRWSQDVGTGEDEAILRDHKAGPDVPAAHDTDNAAQYIHRHWISPVVHT